jgi:D-alanyl-D-alanine dipeptidase
MPNTSEKPSPAEPVSRLRSIKIVECSDEMIDFLSLSPRIIFDKPHFKYRRETVLRRPMAERLAAAANSLPPGFLLAIIEGWRPPHIQRRMYQAIWNRFAKDHPDWSPTRMKRTVNRYSAPMDRRVPPPHTTGGAVDIMLADATGKVLNHSAPFMPFAENTFSFDAPGLSPEARRYRDIMAEVLIPLGVTNYPSEYWHWSYGDQGWAYRGGHPNAIYGATEPAGWAPSPEDDVDAPLEFIT